MKQKQHVHGDFLFVDLLARSFENMKLCIRLFKIGAGV